MNLLRNAGFERGDTSFWEALDNSSVEINALNHYLGAYSGAVTAITIGNRGITHNDYLQVTETGITHIHGYIKAAVGRDVWLRVQHYDEDLNYLGSQSSATYVATGGWDLMTLYYKTRLWSAYIKIFVYYTSIGAHEVFYVDSVYAEMVTEEYLGFIGIEIANLTNILGSGDTSDTPIPFIGHTTYYADISCTSITGTNPTMDVQVCEFDQYSNEVVLGSFAQLTTVGTERISLTPSIGRGMYLKYVKGGVVTDCDFKVFVTGLR